MTLTVFEEMYCNENEVYILNPAYKMRNDDRRTVIYSGGCRNSLGHANWSSFLHPRQAQVFSFFTFNRKLDITLSLLSQYLNKDKDAVRKIITPFIENPLSVYTNYQNQKMRIPKNLIVNRKKISGEVAFLNLTPDIFKCQTIDLTTRRLYTAPQLITFMLSNNCITDCIYCYADTKTNVRKRMPTARIMELIEEAKIIQVRAINLIGGEIFLHRDWSIILKKLVELNMQPEYISTKYPITNDIIRTIKETGFTNPVQISLDACSSDILQNMLSVKNNYLQKVLHGIKLLDNSGLNYRITSVLTTHNAKKDLLNELYKVVSKLKNITDWRITPVSNSIWIDDNKFRQLKPDKTTIESLFDFIEKEMMPYSNIPILLNRSALGRTFHYCTTGSKDFRGIKCSALNNHLFILPDGKVTICEQLYWLPNFIIGDTLTNGILEIWNSSSVKKLLELKRNEIQDSSPCKNCKLFASCFGENNRCWVDIIKAYGKDKWDYPDTRCAFAPPMTRDLRFF